MRMKERGRERKREKERGGGRSVNFAQESYEGGDPIIDLSCSHAGEKGREGGLCLQEAVSKQPSLA